MFKKKELSLEQIEKNEKRVKFALTIIITFISVWTLTQCVVDFVTRTPEERAKIHRDDLIQKHFWAYDDSHKELTRMIKNSLNDPDSYDHVKTVYRDYDGKLLVSTEYLARNGFGGMVRKKIHATTNPTTGEVIEVIYQE